MVDYLKSIVQDFPASVLEANPLLDFSLWKNITEDGAYIPATNRRGETTIDRRGDIVYKEPYKNAFYNGLEFRVYQNGLVTMAGSVHKYWNGGAHNYNDFSFEAFLEVVANLKDQFGINPKDIIIRSLEVGINIIPIVPTNHFLDYCFLHKTKPFVFQVNSDEGKYKQVEHSQYIIKLYNKYLHYKSRGFEIDSEILRFEIKYTKMEKVNMLGIYTLFDLTDLGFDGFKNQLLLEFNNILFYDTSIKSDSRRLSNYNNPLYWTELVDNPNKTNFYKHKDILKGLTANHSDRVQYKTSILMGKKIDYLNTKGASSDHLNIMSTSAPLPLSIESNNILCEVTKINISMQRDDSLLLSHSGLRHYYKNDKKIFEQVRRRYLSKLWFNSSLDVQVKEIAHNIRNTKNNQRMKQKRLYHPQQFNIFSVNINP